MQKRQFRCRASPQRTSERETSLGRGWRESLQDAVDFPVQLSNIRLAACQALFDGSQATSESPGRTADGKDQRSPYGNHGDDDGCGVRGGSPRRLAMRRLLGFLASRRRSWLGRFANRPPTARWMFVSGCGGNRQYGGGMERFGQCVRTIYRSGKEYLVTWRSPRLIQTAGEGVAVACSGTRVRWDR